MKFWLVASAFLCVQAAACVAVISNGKAPPSAEAAKTGTIGASGYQYNGPAHQYLPPATAPRQQETLLGGYQYPAPQAATAQLFQHSSAIPSVALDVTNALTSGPQRSPNAFFVAQSQPNQAQAQSQSQHQAQQQTQYQQPQPQAVSSAQGSGVSGYDYRPSQALSSFFVPRPHLAAASHQQKTAASSASSASASYSSSSSSSGLSSTSGSYASGSSAASSSGSFPGSYSASSSGSSSRALSGTVTGSSAPYNYAQNQGYFLPQASPSSAPFPQAQTQAQSQTLKTNNNNGYDYSNLFASSNTNVNSNQVAAKTQQATSSFGQTQQGVQGVAAPANQGYNYQRRPTAEATPAAYRPQRPAAEAPRHDFRPQEAAFAAVQTESSQSSVRTEQAAQKGGRYEYPSPQVQQPAFAAQANAGFVGSSTTASASNFDLPVAGPASNFAAPSYAQVTAGQKSLGPYNYAPNRPAALLTGEQLQQLQQLRPTGAEYLQMQSHSFELPTHTSEHMELPATATATASNQAPQNQIQIQALNEIQRQNRLQNQLPSQSYSQGQYHIQGQNQNQNQIQSQAQNQLQSQPQNQIRAQAPNHGYYYGPSQQQQQQQQPQQPQQQGQGQASSEPVRQPHLLYGVPEASPSNPFLPAGGNFRGYF